MADRIPRGKLTESVRRVLSKYPAGATLEQIYQGVAVELGDVRRHSIRSVILRHTAPNGRRLYERVGPGIYRLRAGRSK